jgi:two-component system chemotaxis response regulator CheB
VKSRLAGTIPSLDDNPNRPRVPLVVVGASAGGVEALGRFAGGLPAGFPAAVILVLHVSPTSTSLLPEILTRRTKLPVRAAEDGDRLVAGEILCAPAGTHLVLRAGRVRLTHAAPEQHARPSIDVTMRAAAALGGPLAGVVLTGTLHDGTAGLAAIAAAGGLTVVQDPAEAAHAGMPASAIADHTPDAVLPVAEIGTWLADRLGTTPGRASLAVA